MHVVLSLTVSESKRLIAKGVAQAEFVLRAMEEGTLAIGSGTTNGYIIEEITGESFDKKTSVTGRTLPSNYDGENLTYTYTDLVIRKGERLDISAKEALEDMGPGDVFVKGANAINYERDQAAVLIGHPTGGNVGLAIGPAMARRICFLHPVGLEKSVSVDLVEVAEAINSDPEGKGPTLWVVPGPLFTEIEALDVLTGVEAIPAGAGGVGGAEGAVWLALFGTKQELDLAQNVISSVRGEPTFTSA
ncbi:MAG: hypothetical protein HN742_24670 [Lentisphaerae bacterium]|jgi:hypothetical protein|nr:hypothetical protein [Lentisphaerota bacterium]MBT4822913.1 hypothetical protein [Lentisphaerota bacterium]MBT5609762.1 hypothetical protein [Lentisphaerota bacterium]MBT7061404.1 hypothetical protein [Lentisphaerota bacterium]MBT7845094.1 hypothetical protein [Lentisphaerota bacterium]